MPLYWNVSVFMIIYIMFMLCLFYFNKMKEVSIFSSTLISVNANNKMLYFVW